jgi:hypothetical protein
MSFGALIWAPAALADAGSASVSYQRSPRPNADDRIGDHTRRLPV